MTVFWMHHQLGGSTEDYMNKMSVIGHISLLWVSLSKGITNDLFTMRSHSEIIFIFHLETDLGSFLLPEQFIFGSFWIFLATPYGLKTSDKSVALHAPCSSETSTIFIWHNSTRPEWWKHAHWVVLTNKESYHHFASNYIANLRHIHTNHTPQHKSCLKMQPLNKTPRNKCGALPEGAVAPSLEAACKLIIGPIDGWVDQKKTLFENNIHKIGDNLDDVPPLISLPSHHLHVILQDDFFSCSLFLLTWDSWWSHRGTPFQFGTALCLLQETHWPVSYKTIFHTWNFGNSSIILYLVVIVDVVASRFPISLSGNFHYSKY